MNRQEFADTYGFELDGFQERALDALDGGRSVLVAAPTGSGKTLVAEYAVAKALAEGGKAFYTTPIKALSNQKYGDLARRHGAANVGLLTGDNAINGDAPVVVMTTEVLRNMIYAGAPALDGLRYVILDEVHYLENAWRGPVWEEVIIDTPPDVICSRAGCDDAVRYCVDDGLRLTTSAERGAIRTIVEERVRGLSDADLRVLRYGEWLSGLEAGLAAHHAGLVPPFKEAVEACFTSALVKVVFATETLSLGINMPARSVVIEKLTKFTGERHEFLTPGEYTQLTGRAGRRGIDEVGYAIVLWSPFVPFDQVAGLASTRSYALTSSFRPTYNMAANLVHRYRPDQAHHLLNLSFAQYRADADVVRLEAQLERTTQLLAAARARAACDRGDIHEYLELQRHAQGGERAAIRSAWSKDKVHQALERLRPGDVLSLPGAVAGGRLAVITTSRRRGGEVRVGGVSVDTRKITLPERDFGEPPRAVGRIELPAPYAPSSPRFLRDPPASLRGARLPPADRPTAGDPRPGAVDGEDGDDRGDARTRPDPLSAHPVASCPDLREHLRAAARADRLSGDARRLETRIRGRSESLARQFDRVLRVLEAWGYVDGWRLTGAGERLGRIYHEC